MRNGIVFTAVSGLIIMIMGCASYPPPKLEGNLYTNYEYLYTVEMPAEWTPQENFPKDLRQDLDRAIDWSKALVIKNNKTSGIIIIFADKIDADWYDFSKSGAAYPFFNRECEWFLKELANDDGVTVLDSQVYSSHPALTQIHWVKSTGKYKPERMFEVTFDVESSMHKYNAHAVIIPYPCPDQKTCSLYAFVYSGGDSFDRNKMSFDTMVKSLRAIDYTQNQQSNTTGKP